MHSEQATRYHHLYDHNGPPVGLESILMITFIFIIHFFGSSPVSFLLVTMIMTCNRWTFWSDHFIRAVEPPFLWMRRGFRQTIVYLSMAIWKLRETDRQANGKKKIIFSLSSPACTARHWLTPYGCLSSHGVDMLAYEFMTLQPGSQYVFYIRDVQCRRCACMEAYPLIGFLYMYNVKYLANTMHDC